jgi:hypothetical protein
MKKNSLRIKKYAAGILLVFVVAALIGLLRIGNLDKLKGKIKVKDVYLSNINTKLNANVLDAVGEGPVVSKGYDEVKYELKYTLSASSERRDVIITGTLDADNGYASFKRLTGNNITSTLSENDRKIEIVISDVPGNTEITTNVALTINGAPNGYKVNPTFKIKETTAEDYTDVYTNPIEVSTNNVRGIVRNEKGEAIPNILVSIYKNKKMIKEAYTNQNGEYMLGDLPEDNYIVKINEEIYNNVETTIEANGDTVLDLRTERIYPFDLKVHKYITKVDAINLNTPILKTYDNASIVSLPIVRLNSFSGKVYYKIVVENKGEKEGIVSAIKDELPDFMEFNEKDNDGFELKNGYIYDRNLEGITLKPGQKIEDVLVLRIKNTNEARTYLNRVNALGEIYEHVVYIVDGNVYREEDVLEGEQTVRPTDPVDNFGGWYTDSEFTNAYNFNNIVTKDLILYGKTGQKYRVDFYDKDPETGDEDPYTTKEVNGGDPVDEPNDHPDHTGYDFDYWCTVDFNEYNFNLPVNEDLKLISCYTIKKFDVNFYDYQDIKEKSIEVEYKKLIDATEAPTFDETGYTFICWTKDKNNCYDFNTPVTGDVDLYPKHEMLTNAVIFNDENVTTTVDNIPYGNTVDPIDSRGKDGHTFRCWSEDRTNCFDFNTPIIETKTVYAIYDINRYTVTFIDRDPELLTDTQYGDVETVDWGNTVSRPTTSPEHTGYTFKEWTKEDGTTYNFETPVKSNLTLISKYTINSYPVHFHDDNNVTTVSVQYKHTVTPIANPTKEHHVFKNWLDENDGVFNFETLIVKETDLYSSYEEILPPVVSHTPTMWTNQDVTVTLSDNESLVDNTGYSYLYRTSATNYDTYSAPFAISENTSIIAKGVKSDADSLVTVHEIVNIDKLNPTITVFSENTANRNTVTLNVGVQDNESGINYYEVYQDNVKVGEKRFECYNETTYEGYETCRSNLPSERTNTYTVTGLSDSTTYTFKIRAFDKAGNSVWSEELEVTTTTPRIVARLIGYNNSLFTDTVDENTGAVITPKEDKYINFESLAEAFDYEDLYDCKNVQCTIQMVTGTNESVQVLEGQNLTLDLNGKVVSGVSEEYTIKNNGEFTLIESTAEGLEPGKLVNTNGVALLNKTGAHFTMGEGYSDRQVSSSLVSTTKPYIYGETVGVKSENNAYFTMFDGKIVAPLSQVPGLGAVNGKVTGTEYSYTSVSNSTTENERDYQVVTLNILVSPEARINESVYYSKLGSAMDAANRGTTTLSPSQNTYNLMQTAEPNGKYIFEYDANTNTLVSHCGPTRRDHAKSYLVIDLTNEENDKVLNIEYNIPIYQENVFEREFNYTYSDDQKPANIKAFKYNDYLRDELGDEIKPYRRDYTNTEFVLPKGEIYYISLEHSLDPDNYWGEMTITNMTLADSDINTRHIEPQSDVDIITYGFYYDPTDKTIRSSNQYNPESSTAVGYIEVDLTDKEGTYNVVADISMESYGYNRNWSQSIYSSSTIYVGPDTRLTYGTSLGSFSSSSSEDYVDVYNGVNYGNGYYGGFVTNTLTSQATIQGGQKYYIKFTYKKTVLNPEDFPSREEFEAAGCSDQLIIKSLDVVKVTEEATNVNIGATYDVDNDLLDQFIENSNGGVFIDANGNVSTNFTGPNQTVATTATIDLTNDPIGLYVAFDFIHKYGIRASGSKFGPDHFENIYGYNEPTCTSCFEVFQKRVSLYSGREEWLRLPKKGGWSYDSTIQQPTNTFGYTLEGGHEYKVVFNLSSSDNVAEEYSNTIFNAVRTVKLSNVYGTNYNGIDTGYEEANLRNWIFGNYTPEGVLTSNANSYVQENKFLDSFFRIDLTNYDKNQILTYEQDNTYGYTIPISYITSNNRGLTYTDLFNNRDKLLTYRVFAGGYSGNGIILEKGKVYYLHSAAFQKMRRSMTYNDLYASDTLDYGPSMKYIKLTPIEETVFSMGGNDVLVGNVDLTNDREESSIIRKRNAGEPIIHSNSDVYGFEYNEETGWYTGLNPNGGDIAIKKFVIDLTNSSSDKVYVLERMGTSYYDYYSYSDDESKVALDVNTLASIYGGDPVKNYTHITESSTSFTLKAGKINYVQFATRKEYDSQAQTSIRLKEMNGENATNDYHNPEVVREFNTQVDTVQLLRNVNTPNKLIVENSEEVVLDLNGYSLTSNEDYVIENFGDLTVVDTKYERSLASYDSDLAEYQEYVGTCDGCTGPSDEYKLDHILEYADEFGIDINNIDASDIYEFDYTGDVQTFVVPETGLYKLEVWGAQGGYRSNANNGGKGGYSQGIIELQEGETVYVYVGGSGNTGGSSGGFNGGGSRTSYNGGGGATDMRVEGDSLLNRIIVAGGGGSDGASSKPGKAGGGTSGLSATENYGTGGTGATQTSPGTGGSFGKGGPGISESGGYGGAGGGGWFGGGGATPDSSGDDDRGGGGGSGYVYTPNATIVDAYEVTNHVFTTGTTIAGNQSIPTHDGTSTMTGNTGDGYAKISCIIGDEYAEMKNNLEKTYNIKTEPILGAKSIMTNDSGTGIIRNRKDSTLTIKNVIFDVNSSEGIHNEGTLIAEADPVINVYAANSTGIVNEGGNLINNGNLKITLNSSSCSNQREYGATGIRYNAGTYELSNIEITGQNGTGIMVNDDASLDLHSSSISLTDSCNTVSVSNGYDNYLSQSLYNNQYSYRIKEATQSGYTGWYDRNDGVIYNKGIVRVDDGSTLTGQITNFGKASLYDGVGFNDIYQNNTYKYGGGYDPISYNFADTELNIYNTVTEVNAIRNFGGDLNIIEEDGKTSTITSATAPTILNFGTTNTTGAEISSIYNMGELNTNGTNVGTLNNLYTFMYINSGNGHYGIAEGATMITVKGTANIRGGSITGTALVNDATMVVDGTTVSTGIINRNDLTVKGDSVITGNNKPAIDNRPFTVYYWRRGQVTPRTAAYGYLKATVTIGDDDGDITNGPTITTTSNKYAITGNCNSHGTPTLDSIEFTFAQYERITHRNDWWGTVAADTNGRPVQVSGEYTNQQFTLLDEREYPMSSNNLCEVNYYDGSIQNASVTDMTDVMDIPINNIASGYDVLYDNSNSSGQISLASVDNSTRANLIDVNGTPYKSLQTAISEAPDNSVINISGNYDSANRVTVPEGKNLTINYAAGSKLNSYSKNGLINNNGTLTITGSGTDNIVGEFGYENNGTMTFNGTTNTNNVDNYFKQSNLIKNNSNLTIDNVSSSGLDIVSLGENNENKSTLTINDGTYNSNTIFGTNADITVTGGYFDTAENNNYYEIWKDENLSQTYATLKPLFTVNNSEVTISDFDANEDSRYSSIAQEQTLGVFEGSTLNLENSKFGGKSSRPTIYASMLSGNTINISGGQYDRLQFNLLEGGNTYNQTSGTVNGTLVLEGSGNKVTVTGGKINSSSSTGILMNNASGTTVTIGTKGDLIEGTSKLNVSKTNPEISGSTFGISATGTETSPNNLYFYDGVFKGSSNPIDMHVEEIEEGYDIAYRRDISPQEKYLDILPLILNYTTGVYYFDVQLAFDEANIGDKLIWVRDYTNFSDATSYVIQEGKVFELYFSYMKASDTPYFYQYQSIDPADRVPVTNEFIPYSGSETVPDNYTVGTSHVKINNVDTSDPDTGEKVEVPFIINNGIVSVYGASNYGSLSGEPIFESVSGARIITNNGTVDLNRVSAANIKALGTMFKNNENATMNIYQGYFETLQANVITNSGTINFVGDSNDTSDCNNPTYIKVNTTDSLEADYDYYVVKEKNDVHVLLTESIINNADATMNIDYLYFDGDYTFLAIVNNGTIDISDSTIEAIKDNDGAVGLIHDSVIRNNGTMTMDNTNVIAARGIDNNGTLTITGGTIDGRYPYSISNTGTLTATDTIIRGGGKGVTDNGGNTTLTNVDVVTKGETYHGTGGNNATLSGTFKTYGLEEAWYDFDYTVNRSCTNNAAVTTRISGSISGSFNGKYLINNGAIYVGDGKNLIIESGSIGFDDSLTRLAHFCGDYYYRVGDNLYRDSFCGQPYVHIYDITDEPTGSNRGLDYSVSAIEAQEATVTIKNGYIVPATNVRDYTYGLYARRSTITQESGYIDKVFIENTTQPVNLNVKDGSSASGNDMEDVSCQADFQGLNHYGGLVHLNTNRLCHFNDKEDGFTIFNPYSDGARYVLDNSANKVLNVTTDTPYTSIREAINNSSSGDKLRIFYSSSELLTDYDISVDKDLTIDLNGRFYDANLNVDSNATLTITDEAYLNDLTTTYGGIGSITNTSGTVVVNIGTIYKLNNASEFTLMDGNIKNATNTGTLYINGGTVDKATNAGTMAVNGATIIKATNNQTGSLSLVSGEIKEEIINIGSLTLDSESKIDTLYNKSSDTVTLSAGKIDIIRNVGSITIAGATVRYVGNAGYIVVNSGVITELNNNVDERNIYVASELKHTAVINGGTVNYAENDWKMTINNGTFRTVENCISSSGCYLTILGGQITSIKNDRGGYLTIGNKDGNVNTVSPLISNLGGYAITHKGNEFNFYDGKFVSNKPIVIDAQIDDVEENYVPYISTDYDEFGNLTGTYSMTLKGLGETDVKIACVEGICYNTVQEAIDASVRNYSEDYGCPEVKIGDQFYFSVELDADLVLDPQYTLTINLNYHNINDNGFVIPDNITLRNGSRNGENLQSSLSRFLANVFGTDNTSKDIIITKMEDGNALDTAKTYKLYRLENGTYAPLKVDSDGAGKYSIGKETENLKSIKGRIYINNLSTGEYMLKDNLDNELQFTVYEDGTLSSNVRENFTSEYGHMTASAVATLIVSIQTGQFRIIYPLIGLIVITLLIILLLNIKRKSIKETI